MINSLWRRIFVWVLKGNLIIWAINAVLFGLLGLSGYSWNTLMVSSYFSKIALLETGICFIVCGALAFSGSVLPRQNQRVRS